MILYVIYLTEKPCNILGVANSNKTGVTGLVKGSQVMVTCDDGYQTPDGNNNFIATCLPTLDWEVRTCNRKYTFY